jgi:hypothetical protein
MIEKDIGSELSGKLWVGLVLPDDGGRGNPRVQLEVYGARYPYKLDAAAARRLGQALIAGADELDELYPQEDAQNVDSERELAEVRS